MNPENHMHRAIALSLEMMRSGKGGPFGAVVARGETIIAEGFNQVTSNNDPTAHAEILALREAARAVHTYRLTDLTLYATLEPCVMCVGAMVTARVGRLVYGARDEKAGALGSVYDIGRDGTLNHRIEVTPGVMATESAKLLRQFFQTARGRPA